MTKGSYDYILVLVQINIWIQEFLNDFLQIFYTILSMYLYYEQSSLAKIQDIPTVVSYNVPKYDHAKWLIPYDPEQKKIG